MNRERKCYGGRLELCGYEEVGVSFVSETCQGTIKGQNKRAPSPHWRKGQRAINSK